jgi:hypothetical protein
MRYSFGAFLIDTLFQFLDQFLKRQLMGLGHFTERAKPLHEASQTLGSFVLEDGPGFGPAPQDLINRYLIVQNFTCVH